MKRLLVLLAVLSLFVAACRTGSDSFEHPTGSDELVLLVERVGGFQLIQAHLFEPALFAVFGDGKFVRQSPRPEIYPGPALVGFEALQLSDEGLRTLMGRVVDAGLAEGDKELTDDRIADASTTIFTTNIDGKTSVVSVYALGVNETEIERVKVGRILELLQTLELWLDPSDIVGSSEEFTPRRLQIVSQPEASSGQEAPEGFEIDETPWPLAEPLSTFGEEFSDLEASRCGEVDGSELDDVLEALAESNAITRWISEETPYLLFPKILLGDSEACINPLS